MRKRISLFFMPWLMLILLVSRVCLAEGSFWAPTPVHPVPEGAKVTLETDSQEYFLGENVLVHFVLENTGDQPFEAHFGGDSRNSSRPLRFSVTATDEAGKVAEDPDPAAMCFGGPGGPRLLKPGEKFVESLPLMHYCQIEQPGLYTIRATHDFAWKEDERKRPVGETRIFFRMPNSEQARGIVRKMVNLPDSPTRNSWSEHSSSYADFHCLRLPVYMDILASLARQGDKRAFEGLKFIPTVYATETLIQLAGESDKEVALQAAKALYERRLPISQADYKPGVPGSSEPPELSIRGRFLERVWDNRLAPDVRAVARRLLASEDIPTIASGANMILSVGTIEDATAMIDAINRSHEFTLTTREKPDDNIHDLPQPIRELLRAMDALHKRGYSVGEFFGGDAGILLYFHFLNDKSTIRPERWLENLQAFGNSGWSPNRVEAVRSIPQPMPDECVEFVKARLDDRDLGVCLFACKAAGESGNPVFIEPLLEIIATEHHPDLLREAGDAAFKLGAGFPLYWAWADRLVDADLYPIALDTLQSVLDLPSGMYSGYTNLNRRERLNLREAWKEFLARHTEEISAGTRIKLTDPTVTPALAGRARVWRLPDGTPWPEWTETRDPR